MHQITCLLVFSPVLYLTFSVKQNKNTLILKTPITAPDKVLFQLKIIDFFFISLQKHMLWYSLEVPHWGTSNEYPQHMFSWRNKKNVFFFVFFFLYIPSYLELCTIWKCSRLHSNFFLLFFWYFIFSKKIKWNVKCYFLKTKYNTFF